MSSACATPVGRISNDLPRNLDFASTSPLQDAYFVSRVARATKPKNALVVPIGRLGDTGRDRWMMRYLFRDCASKELDQLIMTPIRMPSSSL